MGSACHLVEWITKEGQIVSQASKPGIRSVVKGTAAAGPAIKTSLRLSLGVLKLSSVRVNNANAKHPGLWLDIQEIQDFGPSTPVTQQIWPAKFRHCVLLGGCVGLLGCWLAAAVVAVAVVAAVSLAAAGRWEAAVRQAAGGRLAVAAQPCSFAKNSGSKSKVGTGITGLATWNRLTGT